MKTKKILLLLALGAVLLLSGCQAILDTIFASDSISVYISAYEGTYGYNPSTDQMTVYINGAVAAGPLTSSQSDGSYMYWNTTVPNLSDGNYSVYVSYYHPVGIGAPATIPSSTQTISLPNSGQHTVNLSFGF